tara:strand:+ start:50 stop:271 length:222 start_codon:yes stop_codon:yes gene_type:complete
MRIIVILWVLIITGCGIFKAEAPVVEKPVVEKPIIEEVDHCDSVKLDTSKLSIIDLINVIDTNLIVIDTLKSE